MGVSDEEYLSRGAKILSREEILNKCDIICDPKAGDAEYLEDLQEGRTIFGWVHPHVCENVKNLLLKKHFEVYAWEEMMEDGMQVFYRNNELAGRCESWMSVLRNFTGRKKGSGDRKREHCAGSDQSFGPWRCLCDCVWKEK